MTYGGSAEAERLHRVAGGDVRADPRARSNASTTTWTERLFEGVTQRVPIAEHAPERAPASSSTEPVKERRTVGQSEGMLPTDRFQHLVDLEAQLRADGQHAELDPDPAKQEEAKALFRRASLVREERLALLDECGLL
jgi:hypothetical protein